jgi:hypothetical protein
MRENLREWRVSPLQPGGLTKVRDLEYYEGPLLSLFRDARDQAYLFVWRDADRTANRWLVVKPSLDQLRAFLARTNTLRSIVLAQEENLLVVDIDRSLKWRDAYSIPVFALPIPYFPSEDSYYAPDDETEAAIVALTTEQRSGLIAIHLRDGEEVRHGEAGVVPLGGTLYHFGRLARERVRLLRATNRRWKQLTDDQAAALGAYSYVQHLAASFIAILRPAAVPDLPDVEQLRADVLNPVFDALSGDSRAIEKGGPRADNVETLDTLRALAEIVVTEQLEIAFDWFGYDPSERRSAVLRPATARRLANEAASVESSWARALGARSPMLRQREVAADEVEVTELLAMRGRFTLVNTDTGRYEFRDDAGGKSKGKFSPSIEPALVRFDEEYNVAVERTVLSSPYRNRRPRDVMISVEDARSTA